MTDLKKWCVWMNTTTDTSFTRTMMAKILLSAFKGTITPGQTEVANIIVKHNSTVD